MVPMTILPPPQFFIEHKGEGKQDILFGLPKDSIYVVDKQHGSRCHNLHGYGIMYVCMYVCCPLPFSLYVKA